MLKVKDKQAYLLRPFMHKQKGQFSMNNAPSKTLFQCWLQVFEKPMQTAKQNYEALNAQLLDDLPKMADLATQLFRDCVGSFVRAQREFTDKIVHEMYTVTEQVRKCVMSHTI